MSSISVALLSLLVVLSTAARGSDIVDEEFGFRFDVPDGFTGSDLANSGSRLYQFLDRTPAADDLATVITIERLNGLVDPEQRLNEDEIPEQPGVQTFLTERTWQDIPLDVMINRMEAPAGPVIVHIIQFPLSGEALQLVVGGPVSRSAEVAEVFDQAVEGFENIGPLHGAAAKQILPDSHEATAPAAEDVPGFPWTGLAVFSAMVFVLVAILGKWTRSLLKSKDA